MESNNLWWEHNSEYKKGGKSIDFDWKNKFPKKTRAPFSGWLKIIVGQKWGPRLPFLPEFFSGFFKGQLHLFVFQSSKK
jgi:hypothetical protein